MESQKETKSGKLGVQKAIKKERKKESSVDGLKVAEVEGVGHTKAEEKKKVGGDVGGGGVGGGGVEYAHEYDVKHPTDDAMRNKVRGLLVKALCTDGGKAEVAEPVASAIEEAMFKKFEGNGPPYKSKYRDLSFNLKDKKNTTLREQVLARDIPPSQLIEMSSEELANEELKKRRQEVIAQFTKDAMPASALSASTDQFYCNKCKQRKCTYYQMQTRSADEPLTTFVQCAVAGCGNRWRF